MLLSHAGDVAAWSNGSVAAVNLGAPELLIVLLVILLLFGGAKLPKLAKSLGQAQGEFKKGIKEGVDKTGEDETGTTPSPS
jgi:sec-independent protein translocase protein TatA